MRCAQGISWKKGPAGFLIARILFVRYRTSRGGVTREVELDDWALTGARNCSSASVAARHRGIHADFFVGSASAQKSRYARPESKGGAVLGLSVILRAIECHWLKQAPPRRIPFGLYGGALTALSGPRINCRIESFGTAAGSGG
jgi:hypothetical protein